MLTQINETPRKFSVKLTREQILNVSGGLLNAASYWNDRAGNLRNEGKIEEAKISGLIAEEQLDLCGLFQDLHAKAKQIEKENF